MLVKVNRVYSESQIQLLKEVNIFNFHIIRNDSSVDSNAINVEKAMMIRKRFPNIKISIFFNNYGDFSRSEKQRVLKDLNADYYETSAPDFEETDAYNSFLAEIDYINLPTIVSGFFVLSDDDYLLKQMQSLKELIDHNVQFVEIDVDSIINPSFKISNEDLNRLEKICSDIPVLFSDSFNEDSTDYLKHSKGIYLNMSSQKNDIFNSPGFDTLVYANVTSLKTFEMRNILKISKIYSSL